MNLNVSYRRRTGERRILRTGIHRNSHCLTGEEFPISEKEFRILLICEYNRTNKRVEKIERV